MSRRRRPVDEPENHDRWLVSYADFITLLFAFFVVMYAVSLVNEGMYRVLSDSIVSAFRHNSGAAGDAPTSITPRGSAIVFPLIVPKRPDVAPNPKTIGIRREVKEKMRNMAQEIHDALGPLIQNGQVRITENARGITLDINANVLFLPGDAQLSTEAVHALGSVAQILAQTDFAITVEGHTDNTPIATSQFPSNWELSGVRASSVVRLMIDHGVLPARLTAIGHADQRPLFENDTLEHRARNRRVAITIESSMPDAAESVTSVVGDGSSRSRP